MNVNPEDYDIDELRQMAAERHTPTHPTDRGTEQSDQRGSTNGHAGSTNGHAGSTNGHAGSANGHTAGGTRSTDTESFGHGPSGRESMFGRGSPMRGNPSPRRGAAADALRSNQLEQLFLHQSALSPEQMTKPYLSGLPQKYAAERVVFDWLEFLVLKGGFKGTMDALRYYKTIDWITDEVEARLQDYLIGFTDDGSGSHPLDVDDHQLSLLYVARLASMN